MTTTMEDEQFRVEQLREKIIDWSELHQNDSQTDYCRLVGQSSVSNYQSEEILRDIYDSLDGLEAKVIYLRDNLFQP